MTWKKIHTCKEIKWIDNVIYRFGLYQALFQAQGSHYEIAKKKNILRIFYSKIYFNIKKKKLDF